MAGRQTKKVHLAYGKDGLDIEIPADAVVIEPRYVPGLSDEQAALVRALRDPIASLPLRNLVRPGQKAVIVHSDITRATPNERILPPLVAELEEAGIRREDITLLNALGTHRPQTPEELKAMLGPEVVARYRCVQHDGLDDANLVHLGRTTLGHDVRVNRLFVEADVRILTGFIEPHFFAGFSGGPKGVLPSIAGAESVVSNHSPAMIRHKKACWGVTTGNPIWEEMLQAARMTKPTFLLNVAMNRDKQITGVFAGELFEAHQAGCRFVGSSAMVPVPHPFDVVITSNSGYPLDLNLYQAVKGMSAAAQIVRKGGAIIIAAQCWDGIPDHGHYGRLLSESKSPAELLARVEAPGFSSPDSWQVQMQARIQLKADVHLYADGLTDEQITTALLRPCRRIEDTLERLLSIEPEAQARDCGPGSKSLASASGSKPVPSVCVLPEGPVTVPYIAP